MKDFGPALTRFSRRLSRLLASAAFVLPAAAAADADLSGSAGDYKKTVVVAGITRSWLLHVPAAYSATRPAAVVLLLHRGGSRAAGIERSTGGFSALADRHGFIAVYPESRRGHWDDGRDTVTDHTLAANMPAALAPSCRTARTVPLLMFSGTADSLMPYGGGRVAGPVGGVVLSAPETAAFWASRNGSASVPQPRALPDTDPGDGTTTDLLEFSGDVVLYRINDGGHTWPGGKQYLPARIVGKLSKDFSANDAIQGFFARQALP